MAPIWLRAQKKLFLKYESIIVTARALKQQKFQKEKEKHFILLL